MSGSIQRQHLTRAPPLHPVRLSLPPSLPPSVQSCVCVLGSDRVHDDVSIRLDGDVGVGDARPRDAAAAAGLLKETSASLFRIQPRVEEHDVLRGDGVERVAGLQLRRRRQLLAQIVLVGRELARHATGGGNA